MEWTACRVDVASFSQVCQKLDLVAEEMTGQLQVLAANHDHRLAAQDLLGNDRSQSAKQVSTSVNQNRLKVTNTRERECVIFYIRLNIFCGIVRTSRA